MNIMSKYPFVAQYTVAYYDEDKKVMKHFHHSCVGFCDNFADAVAQIEKSEGTKDLESIDRLELFDEASADVYCQPGENLQPVCSVAWP
jgi:hypothetical protein